MGKKKVAVLHAQVPFVRGGAELLVENLTKQLKIRGFDAEIVSLPFKWYPNNTLLDSYLAWHMLDLTESNGQKIDLVIATKVPTFMIQHPNKVVWLMHQFRTAYDLQDNGPAGGCNTIPGGKELKHKIVHMDNLALSSIKPIYTISKTVTNRLKQYNGIESAPLYHPPALAGKYFTVNYEDYVLSVGRLDPNKRVDLLIRALPYCDPHIRAVIAGAGAIRQDLEELAERLNVKNRVDFLGYVPDEDLPRLYANALAVCFTPIDEDYGYITLEAFLSQKPIITCNDAGGVLEFARDKENAIVCKNDPKEIGEGFNRFYYHKNLAKEYGQCGFESVKDIKWDRVIDTLTQSIN